MRGGRGRRPIFTRKSTRDFVLKCSGPAAISYLGWTRFDITLDKFVAYLGKKALSYFTTPGEECPGVYSEISNKCSDLLYKDFSFNHICGITTYPSSGFDSITTSVIRGDHFRFDSVFKSSKWNIATDVRVSTDLTAVITSTLDNMFLPGLRGMFRVKLPDETTSNIELHYKRDYACVSTSIGLFTNPIANLAVVIGNNVFAVGGDVALNIHNGQFTRMNGALSWTKEDLTFSLAMNDMGDVLKASYYQITNPFFNTSFGAEAAYSFARGSVTWTIGAKHSIDPSLAVKARVSNTGIACAFLQHAWKPNSFFTLSGSISMNSIGNAAKFGIGITF